VRDFIALTKALADPSRLRLLLAFRHHELCVCQVAELIGLALSTTSKHLSILYRAGLLDSRKDGRWIYYRLVNGAGSPAVREAIAWVGRSLRNDPAIADDARRLEEVLQIDPSELCKRQCSRMTSC